MFWDVYRQHSSFCALIRVFPYTQTLSWQNLWKRRTQLRNKVILIGACGDGYCYTLRSFSAFRCMRSSTTISVLNSAIFDCATEVQKYPFHLLRWFQVSIHLTWEAAHSYECNHMNKHSGRISFVDLLGVPSVSLVWKPELLFRTQQHVLHIGALWCVVCRLCDGTAGGYLAENGSKQRASLRFHRLPMSVVGMVGKPTRRDCQCVFWFWRCLVMHFRTLVYDFCAVAFESESGFAKCSIQEAFVPSDEMRTVRIWCFLYCKFLLV